MNISQRDKIIKNYVMIDNELSQEELIKFLNRVLDEDIVNRNFYTLSSDFIIYYEVKYKDNAEIQELISKIKEQIHKKIVWERKMMKSINHTKEQYENAKKYLFNENEFILYDAALRTFLEEVQDNEKILF